MAEVKESMLVLLKLLAHSVMTTLFVIAIAALGTATAFAFARVCSGSDQGICYVIWIALEVPFVFGIVLAVMSQILNQADEFFSSLRKTLKSMVRALRGIRQLLARRGKNSARKRVARASPTKAIGRTATEAVVRLKKTGEAA